MSAFPYRIVVRWSEADEAFVADVPALPGAAGDGSTPGDAVAQAEASARAQLEARKQHGDPIPQADIDEPDFSGQIRLRMPKSLHRELAAAAQREGVSLNQLLVAYLASQVSRPAESFSSWIREKFTASPRAEASSIETGAFLRLLRARFSEMRAQMVQAETVSRSSTEGRVGLKHVVMFRAKEPGVQNVQWATVPKICWARTSDSPTGEVIFDAMTPPASEKQRQ